MGLDIAEATSGMGMHLKDIPPMILERQLKVRYRSLRSSLLYLIRSAPGLLAHHSLLQRRRSLRQSLDPIAILPSIPHAPHARHLLDHDHCPCHLRHLGCD